MGDKQEKRGSITKLRLAYDSTEQGGDGQFHRGARSKPYDPAKKPTGRRRAYNLNAGLVPTSLTPITPAYEGQSAVIAFQRRLDDAIDFDLKLDDVFATMQDMFEFRLMFPFKNPGTKNGPAMQAVTAEIKRVALLPDDPKWQSREHDRIKADLRKKHGRNWPRFHYPENTRHCTPEGLRDIAVSMLFRDQRRRGDLDGAKALIDFMDTRAAKGFTPPTRDDPLCDFPVQIAGNWRSRRPYGHSSEGEVRMYDQPWPEHQWPYDWVMRDDHPALLKYMMDKKSCLLKPTLEMTGAIVASYFGSHILHLVHGRLARSDVSVDLSDDFIKTSHPLARVPGHMRHLVHQATKLDDPAIAAAAIAALNDIDKVAQIRAGHIRDDRREINQRAKRERAIWSPPDQS